jgi:hypothetical protein
VAKPKSVRTCGKCGEIGHSIRQQMKAVICGTSQGDHGVDTLWGRYFRRPRSVTLISEDADAMSQASDQAHQMGMTQIQEPQVGE